MRTRLAVDIGGTFTDVVIEHDGTRRTTKVLTTSSEPERGVMQGVQAVLAEAGIGAGDIDMFVHGTTLATNAIIERKGVVTGLITTEGFRDTLVIADEGRFDQYDIFIDKPEPLVPRYLRLPVPERIDPAGGIRLALDEGAVRAAAAELVGQGVQSVAVGLFHSYVNPVHERRIGEILREEYPDLSVTLSSEVCPEVREYERLSTACANAYVQPLMARYLTRLDKDLHELGLACPFFLMTSGGGLTRLETAVRFPIRLVESGPAGGAILASRIAAECGLDRVLSFDMGGTTAKVCLIEDGQPETARTFEVDRAARFRKGSGLPLRIPVIEMVEIGAGGGSIARLDDLRRITVGPDSAGAEPGPACYGRGGTAATVTDADVALGRIDPDRFAGGKMALDLDAAASAIEASIATPLGLSGTMGAFGITEMVDENMANAARVHAVERGKAVGDYTVIAFGGAAPLHAVRLAEKLSLDRVVVPTNAGVGSAVGFLRAPVSYEVVRSRYMTLSQFDAQAANDVLTAMQEEAEAIVRAGAPDQSLVERRLAYMRYVGQGHEIVVPLPVRALTADDVDLLRQGFVTEYEKLYARAIPGADMEILSFALTVGTPPDAPEALTSVADGALAVPTGRRQVFDAEQDAFVDVPVYWRFDFAPGARIPGPAVIEENETSTFVSARFDAVLNSGGYIIMERRAEAAKEAAE